MNNFISGLELINMGFKAIGKNVLISRKASIYGPQNIAIGDNVRIDDFCILSGNIQIGSHVHIAAYCALFGGKDGIILNDFSGLSSRVSIYATSDDYSGDSLTNPTIPEKYKKLQSGKVIIGKHVIVGSGSVVLPDVELADGGAFGSLSLILKSSEAWTVNAGIPAKFKKQRNKGLLKLEEQFLREWNDEYEEK